MRTTIRRAVIGATALTAALTLAACGSDDTGHGAMPGMGSTSATSAQPSAAADYNQADVIFATSMIPHHEQAVQMADLALTTATDDRVKALANDIKTAQDPEIRAMAGWLTTWGQPVPTGMSGMPGHDMSDMPGMSGMMSDRQMRDLEAATGAQFDRMWLQMMIEHHEGAVTMATTQTREGRNADATGLAAEIVTAQQKEIAAMRQLLPTITG
ncbi:MAG: DUF305 domain-containing protein [Phycicoccus sp.]